MDDDSGTSSPSDTEAITDTIADDTGDGAENTATAPGDTAGEDSGLGDCDQDPLYEVTWDNWGDSFFQTWCQACHSATAPERYGAPEGLDFDTLEQVQDNAALVRWSVLDADRMPLGGGLFDDEAYLLDLFLCGLE